MAYDFLKKLFGETEDGQPKALTYEQLEAAINADKDISLYNLKDGGYIPKDKLDAKIAELAGVKSQLDEANAAIKSYKDMDIDGIKQSAADWEEKYNKDTAALNDKLAAQAYDFAVRDAASGLKFSSNAAKNQFLSDVKAKKLSMEDNKILGFDDYVKSYRESDPGAFKAEEPGEGRPRAQFSAQVNHGNDLGLNASPKFNFGFSHVREPKEAK